MKKLSLEAIETARQIFIKSVSSNLGIAEDPIDIADRIDKAMILADAFETKVKNNQAVNFSVDLGSSVDTGIYSLNPEALIKTVISAVDNQAANSFDKFSTVLPLVHIQKYKKTPIVEGALTCFYEGVDYCDHAYPEWMVCKTKDRNGAIFGWSTDNLVYSEASGYWVTKTGNPDDKFVLLLCEDCLVEPSESFVSIDLPF